MHIFVLNSKKQKVKKRVKKLLCFEKAKPDVKYKIMQKKQCSLFHVYFYLLGLTINLFLKTYWKIKHFFVYTLLCMLSVNNWYVLVQMNIHRFSDIRLYNWRYGSNWWILSYYWYQLWKTQKCVISLAA